MEPGKRYRSAADGRAIQTIIINQKDMRKIKNSIKNFIKSPKTKAFALMMLVGTTAAFAQNAAGDYTAGTNALATVTEEIAKYIPFVVKLCYAIAGVVAVVGAISVYIAIISTCFLPLPNHSKFNQFERLSLT